MTLIVSAAFQKNYTLPASCYLLLRGACASLQAQRNILEFRSSFSALQTANMARNETTQALLHQRLLSDIADTQHNPYPGIELHFQDETALQSACLILTLHDEQPMHLTISFTDDYPLSPPHVTMQSAVLHPNIFDDYICASVLDTREGYTPAYTLKGICIQLLSFFGSDKIEQDYGGVVDRTAYQQSVRESARDRGCDELHDGFSCSKCGFGQAAAIVTPRADANTGSTSSNNTVGSDGFAGGQVGGEDTKTPNAPLAGQETHLVDLPNDVLVLICEHLNEEGMALASQAWNGFGRLIHAHNVVIICEMCCFTLRKGFKEANLGVGVRIDKRSIQSEFDLISQQAVFHQKVRRSVQGVHFEHWLPLPLSETHWRRVKGMADDALTNIGNAAAVQGPVVTVLYTFMNDVVVKLS